MNEKGGSVPGTRLLIAVLQADHIRETFTPIRSQWDIQKDIAVISMLYFSRFEGHLSVLIVCFCGEVHLLMYYT